MRRTALTFAAAACLLLAAATAHAEGLNRPPFEPKNPTIDVGVLDPTDPCILHPQLCGDPPPPPPNPCDENPELCDPEPPPPCTTKLCTPPCDLAPELCKDDPPVAQPEDPTAHPLAGNVVVKAGGTKSVDASTFTLTFDTSARTFLLADGSGGIYTGNLVARGTSGSKFTLFFDNASETAFAAFVAKRGADVVSGTAGNVLGDSGKLVLKLDESGAASLKIRMDVLTSGVGAVVLKANLVEVL